MSPPITQLFFLLLSIAMAIVPSFINRVTATLTPETMLTSNKTKSSNCIRTCGDVIIPYPFGIGPECALNDWFSITCDETTTNSPKAFLTNIIPTYEILSLTETEVVIRNNHTAIKCYDSQEPNITWELNISESPFTLSSTSNSLTVIGCNDYALIGVSNGTYEASLYYRSGCITVCANPSEVKSETCSGLGCCQTSIPPGLQHFTIDLYKLENRQNNTRASQSYCSYAFFAKNQSFTFDGASDLTSGEHLKSRAEQVPFALSWAFDRNKNCKETNNSDSNYLCQSNTKCVNSEGQGYRCECLPGYEGHPYLKPGCRDIDECADPDNPCSKENKICRNNKGNYTCESVITTPNTPEEVPFKILYGLGIFLGTILLLLAVWYLHIFMKTREKAKNFRRNGGFLLQHICNNGSAIERKRTKIFTADELDIATDHFNRGRILGEGGHGTVYKGMLSEGRVVAIKKSKKINEREVHQFINEIFILSQINQRHIVKLLGCCLETEVPLLVYEFIPNGTLSHHIHCPNENFPITWKMRLQIAYDAAGALDYLHTLASDLIVHRDVKTANILLDDKYQVKIADFGLARLAPIDHTHITGSARDSCIVGTFGYLDPEYFITGKFTQKSDVYSFGMVLVELLTGQKAIRDTVSEEEISLRSWFFSHKHNNNLLNIIDSKILQDGSEEEFLTIANLAEKCLNMEGINRPTMKQVQQGIYEIRSRHFPPTGRQMPPTGRQMQPELSYELAETDTNDLPRFRTSYPHDSLSSSPEAALISNSHQSHQHVYLLP